MAVRLCSVDKVKELLRIPASETALDGVLAPIVEEVSADCEKKTGRAFTEATYTDEAYRGGSDSVVLKQYPVATSPVPVVKESDGVSANVLAATNYVINYANGIIRLQTATAWRQKFLAGPAAVLVTYKAGYASSGTGTAQRIAVPDDLAISVAELSAAKYRNRQAMLSNEDFQEAEARARSKWREHSRLGW